MMFPLPRFLRLTLSGLPALALLASSCESRTGRPVRQYVELAPRKDAVVPPPPAVPATQAVSAPEPEAGGKLSWTAPAGWSAEPASGMRLASYKVAAEGGEGSCSVVMLAGDGGGPAANLRRWMGQVGLPPPPDPELNVLLGGQESFTTKGGWTGRLLDLTALSAPEAPSMLAASVDLGGRTAFLKLTGTCAWLKGRRGDFRAFCLSLESGS